MTFTDGFEGFANAPVKKNGDVVDFRDVKAFNDKSEAGKILKASQTTEGAVASYKQRGKGANGVPAAVVGKSTVLEDAPAQNDETTEGEGAKQD